jgi:exopolysaccharide biosynthesis protein
MGVAKFQTVRISDLPSTDFSFRIAYIECAVSDVTIEALDKRTVPNSGLFGINGTFFNMSTYDVLGIAIQDGKAVKPYSASNGMQGNRCRGTIVKWQEGQLEKHTLSHIAELGEISQIQWAIGGISLHCDRAYDQAEYYAAIRGQEGAAYINDTVGEQDHIEPALRPRTAIGLKDDHTLLLVVVEQATPWQTRLIMQWLGCCSDVSLLLDGGRSSAFRAMAHDGSIVSWHGNGLYRARKVQTMVAVTNATWI